jgi:hypothetical protein
MDCERFPHSRQNALESGLQQLATQPPGRLGDHCRFATAVAAPLPPLLRGNLFAYGADACVVTDPSTAVASLTTS